MAKVKENVQARGTAKVNPFAKMEEDALSFWQENKIFEKSVEKDAPKGSYVFYDGPPFITGLPHYATLLPSIAKDVIPRYWTMKGYRVERVWGWDCHGLPAENKVEKELELRNKKDIEKLGVGKFVDACRNYVNTGSEQWKWYIDRIGRWVDMDNAYKTMDKDFMESVLWAFKKLYDDGLIYEGYRTSLHCPRCATPLSKFEITMDAGSYKDVDDETVIVKFKVKDQKDTYILAWTTTPWTLPGNLALAVGKDIDYTKLEIEESDAENLDLKKGDKIILAGNTDTIIRVLGGPLGDGPHPHEKDLTWANVNFFGKGNVLIKNIEQFRGSDLVGLEYEPVFDLGNERITKNEKTYKVYAADFVTTEEGTGIVHIAPNFGEDDFNLGKEVGLPIIDLMDENGIYTEEAGNWAGEYFKKANTRALAELGGKLFLQTTHKHSYPFCYRCNTRLIHKTQKAWYLKISEIREKMLASNKKDISWMPEYFKEGRFHNNIENAPDWCLSRSRYWGSPIPVWRCETCGEIKVAGSITEIEELSGEKIEDLHRPVIDKPEFECKCGGKMKRVPEVFDCWFESASMPFAQFHYPHKRKEEWKEIFPADFIIEYTGQLRGWFYYLHVLSNALFDSVAFKNVIVTGVLVGTDGRKMSKSFGNYPDPKMTLEKYGSDALRMYFMGSPIMTGGDMALSEKDIQDSLRKNVIVLWNVVRFYDMFAVENSFKLKVDLPASDNILDKWILIRLAQLHREVTENLEKYDMPAASRPITVFIDELSTWYVRRSRDRFKGTDETDKQSALEVTSYVILQLSKIMAPFAPFIAEQVWQKITGNEFKDEAKSVHLEEWPTIDNFAPFGGDVANATEGVLKEMEAVRKIVELGLAKRDEENLKVRQPLNELRVVNSELTEVYIDLVKDEVNVKNVLFSQGEGDISVELDTEITEELKLEGMKRELVRFINSLRKNAGLSLNDRIDVCYETESEIVKNTFAQFETDILGDTLADAIQPKVDETLEFQKEIKANGEEFKLGILKK